MKCQSVDEWSRKNLSDEIAKIKAETIGLIFTSKKEVDYFSKSMRPGTFTPALKEVFRRFGEHSMRLLSKDCRYMWE